MKIDYAFATGYLQGAIEIAIRDLRADQSMRTREQIAEALEDALKRCRVDNE